MSPVDARARFRAIRLVAPTRFLTKAQGYYGGGGMDFWRGGGCFGRLTESPLRDSAPVCGRERMSKPPVLIRLLDC